MKTTLTLLAMASLGLASCSNDTEQAVNLGQSIDFRAGMATRASETTLGNLEEFTAFALLNDEADKHYFSQSGKVFKKSESGNVFESAVPAYWPNDGELHFYAVSPSFTDLGVTPDWATKSFGQFSIAEDINNQKDLIFADATGTKTANENSGVELSFHHALTQIQIKAKNGNDTYTVKVKGVKFAQVEGQASKFDFRNYKYVENTSTHGGWVLAGSKTTYQIEFNEVDLGQTGDEKEILGADKAAMLLPQALTPWNVENDKMNTQNGAYIALKVEIRDNLGNLLYPKTAGGADWAAMPLDTDWLIGHKFIYTLNFTNGAGFVDPIDPINPDPDHGGDPILGGKINFDVDVRPWTDKTEGLEMK